MHRPRRQMFSAEGTNACRNRESLFYLLSRMGLDRALEGGGGENGKRRGLTSRWDPGGTRIWKGIWILFHIQWKVFGRIYGVFGKFLKIITLNLLLSSGQFRGIKHIHISVQPSPPSISRTLLPCKTEAPHPLNTNSSFSFP